MSPKKPTNRTRRPAAKKRPVAKKTPSKGKKGPKKPRGMPSVTTPVRSAKPTPIKFIVRWLAPVLIGCALGGLIAGFFLWTRALRDVDTFLTRPPSHQPALLLSAPMQLYKGQAISRTELTSDLFSAGYEQVPILDGPNQFTQKGDTYLIRTGPFSLPDESYPGTDAQLTIRDGRIAKVSHSPIVLRPTVLAKLGTLEIKRTPVSLKDISPFIPTAVLGMEDHRFRDHGGIDPLGILRALIHNLRSNRSTHGGSTITQQLAKNLFLSQDRTIQRKVREVFFAAALESRMTKDEILELYLSEVYLGQVSGVPLIGIEDASRHWFGVSADKINLAQAALMAAVISSPNGYSPSRHPEIAKKRRDIVLDKLVRLERISPVDADTAKRTSIQLVGGWRGRAARAPWAMDVVTERVEAALGPEVLSRSGIRVHTTIQPHLQRLAQRAVSNTIAQHEAKYATATGAEGALVSIDIKTGAVVAMVGGRSYFESPFNRATNAWRQGGSIVKPLLLLSAMNRDRTLHPATKIPDEPLERNLAGKQWSPQNSDGLYRGEVTLREAIESSRNIPAIHLSEWVGLPHLQRDLKNMGFSKASRLPSAALGAFATTPMEAASAYTVFATDGVRKEPKLVTAVVIGNSDVLWKEAQKPVPIAKARATTLVNSILQGVIQQGTARTATGMGIHTAGGKTGTTDNFRDAWFVGYTPILSTAVWVGKDRGGGIGLSGARAALPIWSQFTVDAAAQRNPFPQTPDAVHHTLCRESGQLATPKCPLIYDEIFWMDQTAPESCETHDNPKWSIGQLFRGFFKKKKQKSESHAN